MEPNECDEMPIDPQVHRRLLRFLNQARTPEDLMVAPHDRKVADEDAAHMDHVEHHPKEKQVLDRELAERLICERDRISPLHGFGHLKGVFAIDPRIRERLKDLISSFGPATYGRWDLLYDLEVGGTEISIEHAALLRTYEIVFLADGTDTLIWDPSDEVNPQFTLLSGTDTDLAANLLCCGHSFLSDGQLMAVGGGGFGPGNPTSNQAWKFDPIAKKWKKTVGDMSIQRWYPTAMTLGDELGPTGKSGRVLVASGVLGAATPPSMDVYSEASDSFNPVTVTGAVNKSFPQTYPSLHLLPGGEVFYVPTGFGDCSTGSAYALSDPSAYFMFSPPSGGLEGSWTNVGSAMNRTKGMSALLLQPTYPFVRVIVVGGGDSGTNATAQMINLSTLSPSWGAPISIPDGRSRVNVNAVLLPDGSVFVCGGTQSAPHTSWRYNPSTPVSPWSEMDELNAPRHYHSCALLLPSGKVMAAGGAASGGCTASVENTIEVFSPPYLFNPDGSPALRPSIVTIDGVTPTANVAPTVHHGATFDIETPYPCDIAKVVLVRPMAVTHNTDTEQRVIQCTFAKTGACTLSAVAPNGIHPHAMAPRGYYMLFILNTKGVPSEGKFIHLH
ncbi:MAG: galactose oxidase-like domain-containing protein [Gammaproteobacteria bacterium]